MLECVSLHTSIRLSNSYCLSLNLITLKYVIPLFSNLETATSILLRKKLVNIADNKGIGSMIWPKILICFLVKISIMELRSMLKCFSDFDPALNSLLKIRISFLTVQQYF